MAPRKLSMSCQLCVAGIERSVGLQYHMVFNREGQLLTPSCARPDSFPPLPSIESYARMKDEQLDEVVRSLGGPDDKHYAALGAIQPIEVIECWSKTWPSDITYMLAETINMIARVGTKGQPNRDIRKAIFLLQRTLNAPSLEVKP